MSGRLDRRVRRWMTLILGASALGLAGAGIFEGGPSAVIYPKQKIPLIFTHDRHTRANDEQLGIKGEGLACDFCHEHIQEETSSAERQIPGHEVCENCHIDWMGAPDAPPPIKDCARCHGDLDPARTSSRAAPLEIPAPNIRFSHADHAKAKVLCTECHSRVPDKTLATRDDYPKMDRCIECHESRRVSTECKTCHLTGATGRLVTRFPEGNLVPARYFGFMAHTGDFLRDHALPATRQGQLCQQCHGQDDCLQCHDGVARNVRYHPGDWIAVHGIRSRLDDFRCQSCHREQTFCLSCHVRTGVATIASAKDQTVVTRSAISVPHPREADGWLNPRSRNFHGFHAQRNIRSCVSCHQEQFCLACHSSAFGNAPSRGGNPHGNAERLRGSTVAKNNARVCLKCHSPADPSWR